MVATVATMSSSSLPLELADHYRWYLCIQTKPDKWHCVRTTTEGALEKILVDNKQFTPTKAIPISKYTPKIFDPLILHSKMHPHVGINM